MKLTPKNSIHISDWKTSDDPMKLRLYELINDITNNPPVEAQLTRSGVHSSVRMQYENHTSKNMSIPGQFFMWMLSHVKFVKRRCFCIIDDKMIGATIHKSGGLWLTKIEMYHYPGQ